jgi:hypothetical protein
MFRFAALLPSPFHINKRAGRHAPDPADHRDDDINPGHRLARPSYAAALCLLRTTGAASVIPHRRQYRACTGFAAPQRRRGHHLHTVEERTPAGATLPNIHLNPRHIPRRIALATQKTKITHAIIIRAKTNSISNPNPGMLAHFTRSPSVSPWFVRKTCNICPPHQDKRRIWGIFAPPEQPGLRSTCKTGPLHPQASGNLGNWKRLEQA